MKIIATTATGFLVDMTEADIAAAMGFQSIYDKGWGSFSAPARNRMGFIQPGAVFSPTGLHNRLQSLQSREAEIRKGAEAMTALATLTITALDGLVTPPPQAIPSQTQEP
jgi:hypothetical protein